MPCPPPPLVRKGHLSQSMVSECPALVIKVTFKGEHCLFLVHEKSKQTNQIVICFYKATGLAERYTSEGNLSVTHSLTSVYPICKP